MAPEVMCRQRHTFSVDYFALGVLLYELMLGKRPYLGRTRKEIRDEILARQVQLRRRDIPEGWSVEAADFTNKLLQRKPASRLGATGIHELKRHPWLWDFDWQGLREGKMAAPYRVEHRADEEFVDFVDEGEEQLLAQNRLLLRRDSIQDLFNCY